MWLASSGMVGRHLWQRGLAFCARQGRTCLQNSLLGPLVPSTANWLCEGILLCPQIYLLKTTGAKQPLPGLNGLTDLRQPANKQSMKKKIPNSFVLLSALELTFLTLWEEGCCFNKTNSVYLSAEWGASPWDGILEVLNGTALFYFGWSWVFL